MKKNKSIQTFGIAAAVVTTVALVMSAIAPNGSVERTFTPLSPQGIWPQAANPPIEHIDNNVSFWSAYVGSPGTGTHFARLRVGLPEHFNLPYITRFCVVSTIRLPDNFFSTWNDGRVGGGTDNYRANFNGAGYGASGGNELRASIYITADGRVHVRAEHQNFSNLDFYVSDPRPAYLSTGVWHDVTLCGNVAAVEGWYMMVDGAVIAQGVAMLAPASVPLAERIITRMYCGPDGAYRLQVSTPLKIDVAKCSVYDHDPNGILSPAPATQAATMSSTPTAAAPNATLTPTVTRTAIPAPSVTITPTARPSAIPTVCLPQYQICIGTLP